MTPNWEQWTQWKFRVFITKRTEEILPYAALPQSTTSGTVVRCHIAISRCKQSGETRQAPQELVSVSVDHQECSTWSVDLLPASASKEEKNESEGPVEAGSFQQRGDTAGGVVQLQLISRETAVKQQLSTC